MRRQQGMTLIELMVATGIFLFLGSALIMFLNVGINMWRVGEVRREAFERAEAIFTTITADLTATFPDSARGRQGQGFSVDVRFASDADGNGRQRIRFVKALEGEMRHPITQRAGELTGAKYDYDFGVEPGELIGSDAEQMELGMLRAPGGLQEVAYLMDPDPTSDLLFRALRSPIGGAGTVFDSANLYVSDPLADLLTAEEDIVPRPAGFVRPLADGVLHFEVRFWGQDTRQWQPEFEADEGVATLSWDSTSGTDEEPRDDVFPSRAQILLVLRPARAARFARLAMDISEDTEKIPVDRTSHYPDGAFQYIKIDDEWIRYGRKTGNGFYDVERGVRGTIPAEHDAGATVLYGTTFSRVVRIPGARRTMWGG